MCQMRQDGYFSKIRSQIDNICTVSNSVVVLFSSDPPKVVHTPKTATHRKHPQM